MEVIDPEDYNKHSKGSIEEIIVVVTSDIII